VTFGIGYATQFEVRVSADGTTWRMLASVSGHDGRPCELTCEPTEARWVRICGAKPDGPNQQGTQMAIAELEVYE